MNIFGFNNGEIGGLMNLRRSERENIDLGRASERKNKEGRVK